MNSTTTQPTSPGSETAIIPVISEYIGVRPGYCGGEPHILGHRITIRNVAIWHEDMGMGPAQIAETYPTITPSQVYAALVYYSDHRDEIRAAIAEDDRFIEELKAKSGPSLLQERIKQRNASEHPIPPR